MVTSLRGLHLFTKILSKELRNRFLCIIRVWLLFCSMRIYYKSALSIYSLKNWFFIFLCSFFICIVLNSMWSSNTFLPPIGAAEIVDCVRKYMGGRSQNMQSLTRSSHDDFALTDYG